MRAIVEQIQDYADITQDIANMLVEQELVEQETWDVLGNQEYFDGFVNEEDAIRNWEQLLQDACNAVGHGENLIRAMQNSITGLEQQWVRLLQSQS